MRTSLVCLALILAASGAAVAQEDPGGPVDADRVVVKFAGDAFEIVSVTPLSTVLPPSDDLPDAESSSGFWFELVAGEEVRYRRVIDNPVRLVFEGPDMDAPEPGALTTRTSRKGRFGRRDRFERDDTGGFERPSEPTRRAKPASALRTLGDDGEEEPDVLTADRKEAIPAERVFALLIPRAASGDELVLFGAPLEPGTEGQAASELARLPLQDQGGEG